MTIACPARPASASCRSILAGVATVLALLPLVANAAETRTVTIWDWDRAWVHDGDSIICADCEPRQPRNYRLLGIDAFELGQPCLVRGGRGTLFPDATGPVKIDCGEISKLALETLIGGRPVTCTWTRVDRYRRPLATCGTTAEPDLARAMVSLGWAPRWCGSRRNADVEAEARAAGRGVWGWTWAHPCDWRKMGAEEKRAWGQ